MNHKIITYFNVFYVKMQLKKSKLEKCFLGAQTGIQVSQEIRLPSPNSPVIRTPQLYFADELKLPPS